MLAKEKKRAAWSLVVGGIIAGLVLGWGYLQALRLERKLPALIADCEKPLNPPLSPKWEIICDPKELMESSNLKGVQAKIATLAMEADEDQASRRLQALVVFLIFCLPLVWYFLLDRLKEVSAAIRKP